MAPPADDALRQRLTGLLEAQRLAFSRRPPGASERVAALQRLERALLARQDEIAAAVSRDFGNRAVEETFALELYPLLREIRHACQSLGEWMAVRPKPVPWLFWPAAARVVHQPLGVVGVLSPWNYPVLLSLGPVVGALAAGNHVLLKPSELAPETAALIASMVADLYSPDYVSVVTGGPETAAAFSSLPFDHLLFTGSTRVGRLVMRAASEHLVPVTLELGGKSPAIVHPDYPLERAARRIMAGKLYTAGQTCVAPDYVLVPETKRDAFLSAARAAVARLYPTFAGNPDYARVITAAHYRRLDGLVDDARQRGAEVHRITASGEVYDETTRVFPPTLVTHVRGDMALLQEEIFGPVLPIVEYASLDDALGYVAARPHPLAAYYFDDRPARAARVAAAIHAGGVTVNDCIVHVGQVDLPFGGVGPSGMGRYHGFDGFETFSHKKAVFHQGRWTSIDRLRPPYTARARRILRFLLRRA